MTGALHSFLMPSMSGKLFTRREETRANKSLEEEQSKKNVLFFVFFAEFANQIYTVYTPLCVYTYVCESIYKYSLVTCVKPAVKL